MITYLVLERKYSIAKPVRALLVNRTFAKLKEHTTYHRYVGEGFSYPAMNQYLDFYFESMGSRTMSTRVSYAGWRVFRQVFCRLPCGIL